MVSLPLTPLAATELVPHFRRVLECCRVKPEELVLIHTDSEYNPHYPAACQAAAMLMGAYAYVLTVPASIPEGDSPYLVETWKNADLVVDMVSAGVHAYSSTLNQAADSGTRILRVAQPIDCLLRMFPNPEVREQSRAYATRVSEAKEIQVTSGAGTDLSASIVGRPGAAYYGMADEPGRWDHWPSGLVACAPQEDSAEGVLVIEPGDVFLGWGQMVSSPIRCELSEGKVRSITGGADAGRFRAELEASQDDRARTLGIVGWGLSPQAQWHRILDRSIVPGGIMDTEAFLGNLLLVFGSNTSVSLRGENATNAHVNINCLNQSISLDGEPVVEAGRLVEGSRS